MAEGEAKYIKIKVPELSQEDKIKLLQRNEINCDETTDKLVEAGYRVVYPVMSGVEPGKGDILPASGGAVIKFYPDSEYHGSLYSKFMKNESIKSDSNALVQKINSKINVETKNSLSEEFGSIFLEGRIALQNILASPSEYSLTESEYPEILMSSLRSVGGLYKEKESLNNFDDLNKILDSKKENNKFDPLGKFKFISTDAILAILEKFILASYVEIGQPEETKVYYPIVKSNSGISFFSLYLSLKIHLSDNSEEISIKEEFNKLLEEYNGSVKEYLENSDLKKYSDLTGEFEWDSAYSNISLDFIIQEIFSFFIPYFKIYKEIGSDYIGLYTLIDNKQDEITIGYAKTPDLSFELPDGSLDDSFINFGLEFDEEKDKYSGEHDKKTFLIFDINFGISNLGKRSLIPIKYLPVPKINITENLTADEFSADAKVDLAGNMVLGIDVKDIFGGEFESFGLNRAPNLSDYVGRICLNRSSPLESLEEKFTFYDESFSKGVKFSDIEQFAFPNIIGGVAVNPSFSISSSVNAEEEISTKVFPSGNFNIAMMEKLSPMESSVTDESSEGVWLSNFKSNLSIWHESNVEKINSESYMRGQDSPFFNANVGSGKGLSQDMGDSFASYRSYIISNGIPNTEYMVKSLGFRSLKDYLNFNGRLDELLLIYNDSLEGNSSSEKKLEKILGIEDGKGTFLTNKDGVLYCRPRIVDNNSNIIGEQLSIFDFSKVDISTESDFRESPDKVFIRIKSSNLNLKNLNLENENLYLNFYIIDKLGQYRRSSVKIRIQKTDDISTLKVDKEFYSQTIKAEDLIDVPVTIDSSGEMSIKSEVALTAALDPFFSAVVGTSNVFLNRLSNQDFSLTSDLNWSQAFNIPLEFSGFLYLKAENRTSESEEIIAPVNTPDFTPVEMEKDEFTFHNDDLVNVPISNSDPFAKIEIKSKNKLFKNSGDLRFYYTIPIFESVLELSNEVDIDNPISKISSLGNVFYINDGKNSYIVSASIYSSISEAEVSPPFFGFGGGGKAKIPFPSKNFKNRDLSHLEDTPFVSIISCYGDISLNIEPNGKLIDGKYSVINAGTKSVSNVFVTTPKISEMIIISDGNSKYTGEINVLRSNIAKPIMRGFAFKEGQFSCNVDEKSKFDLILALKGGPYKKRDIKFFINSEKSFSQKKISGRVLNPHYDEENKHTIFRINSIKGEKDKGDFQIKVFLKSKKYGPLIGCEDIIFPQITVDNSNLQIDEKTRELILKKEEIFNLSDKTFSKYSKKSEPKQGELVFTELSFPDTQRYSLISDYTIGAVSEVNKKDKVITISEAGVEIPIDDADLPQLGLGSFPPSLPSIIDVLKPDVSFEVSAEGASFSFNFNPIEPYISNNPMGSLAKLPNMIGGSSSFHTKEEYIKKIKSIFLFKDSRISKDYYEPGPGGATIFSPISILGISKVTFGTPKLIGAEKDGEFFSQSNFDKMNIKGGTSGVVNLLFDGTPSSGIGLQMGGAELPYTFDNIGGQNILSFPYNAELLEGVRSNYGLTNLVLPSMASGPCDPLDLVESDSAIRESKSPPRDFSEGLNFPIPNIPSPDIDEVFENLDLMELAYGKLNIRKPLGATKETLRSICDLSFHMTAELRVAIRGLKNLLVVIKVIFCIIDVICALGNPVKLGQAIVRLFLCLFDLLLLLPQLAIPLSFLKLLIHIGELALCLIVKVLKVYTALSEISIALGEALALKDYESIMRLEKALNKHLFSLDADLSVLDPILDILDMFLELLELFFRFPCSTAEGGELFQVCGASDNTVCNIIIGKLVKNGGIINTEALIPVAQSYTTMTIEDLTKDEVGNPTVNCGNTPPDEASDMPRGEMCYGNDDIEDIFIEPRKIVSALAILENTFDEDSINGSSLRTITDPSLPSQIEATYRVSFTRNGKQPPNLSNILEAQDARKCSFHFNYKGITNKFAYENLIYWLFPKKVIDPDQTSDSPLFPLRRQGQTLVLDKDFSDGFSFCNPLTGAEYTLTEEESGVFTVGKYKLEYLDSNGVTIEDTDHKVPEVVLVDDDFNVYIIEKIYVETDQSSDKFGIYKIDAIRADYPTFDSKKFVKEDEQYIADPKIYYADQNYSALLAFFKDDPDHGWSEFDLGAVVSETAETLELTDDAELSFESIIHLFKEGATALGEGDSLYKEFGIIPFNSAINSDNISEESMHTVAHNSNLAAFNFKGGYIFHKVYDYILNNSSLPNKPAWVIPDTAHADFIAAKLKFQTLFDGDNPTLLESYGSFPYTKYSHFGQTFRDPTNSYLNAFTSSIGTASVYDFPNLYIFDIDSIRDELVQQCERFSAEKAAMEDNNPDDIAELVREAVGCINKVKTGNIERRNQIRQRLSSGQGISDLSFIKDPTLPAKEIKEMAECLESIALNDLCKIAINDLSTEFLIMEKVSNLNTNIYQSPTLGQGEDFPFEEDEVDIREISNYVSATGADKFSRGVGDNGVFQADDEISIRVILRGIDDELIKSGSLDFSNSMTLNIISDSGGQAEVLAKDGSQFTKTQYIEEDGSINFAYDAIIKSPIPSEIEVTANICKKEIKAWAPTSLLNSLSSSSQDESCNESNILNTQNIFAFAQLSKTPRVLSITINEKLEVKDVSDFDSGSFGSKQQGSTFGEQE